MSRAVPDMTCQRRGLGTAWYRSLGQHDPLSFVSGCARIRPILSCFSPTHLARMGRYTGVCVPISISIYRYTEMGSCKYVRSC
jgi:hypothetical protein